MSFDEFGSRRGKPFNPDDIPWDEITKWTPRVLLGLVVVAMLFLGTSMFFRIDASDEGVVLSFGEYKETVSPGLHWKLPWPIETVYKVPVQRIQTLEQELSADGHFLIECIHNCGHAIPPFEPPEGESDFAPVWQFVLNHPYWLDDGESPYQQQMPANMPVWCGVGVGSAEQRAGQCDRPSQC